MTIDQFIVNFANVILNPLILLMFAIALVVFLWGVVQYIKDSDSEQSRSIGGRHMLWGIFGMFIMVSVYGILQILANTLFGS